MSQNKVPENILIVPMPDETETHTGYEPLRGEEAEKKSVSKAISVEFSKLSVGVQEFLTQMQTLLQNAPTSMGNLELSELEVSAGINASGKLTLFGFGGAEAGVTGGLKFVFKTSILPESRGK